MDKFKEDLEKHLEAEYEKYKHVGIHNNYHSGYCGAVIGLINWIKEYDFNYPKKSRLNITYDINQFEELMKNIRLWRNKRWIKKQKNGLNIYNFKID